MPRRLFYAMVTLIAYGAVAFEIYWLWERSALPHHGPSQLLPPIIMLLICVACAARWTYLTFHENIYRLRAGEVVDGYYRSSYLRCPVDFGLVPISFEQLTVVVPELYKLKLRDVSTGHTGWVRVDSAAYEAHPIGSHYCGKP